MKAVISADCLLTSYGPPPRCIVNNTLDFSLPNAGAASSSARHWEELFPDLALHPACLAVSAHLPSLLAGAVDSSHS